MRNIKVRVHKSSARLKKENQLAWKIAEIASDNASLNEKAIDMVINRIIDNAAVAIASIERQPVISARDMALAHPREDGATIFGINSNKKFHCEWAAWANGTAVRELDFHDTFLAADYSHPGDNIPPILAVAQQKKLSGIDLIRGIITAYEVQVNLVKGICLHEHKIDHIAHLGPSVAAGLGSLLKLLKSDPDSSDHVPSLIASLWLRRKRQWPSDLARSSDPRPGKNNWNAVSPRSYAYDKWKTNI